MYSGSAGSLIIPHLGIFVASRRGPVLRGGAARTAHQLDTANLGFPISEVRRNDKRFVTSNTFRINLNRQEGRTGQTMHINGGNSINNPKETFSSGLLIVMSPVSRNIAR